MIHTLMGLLVQIAIMVAFGYLLSRVGIMDSAFCAKLSSLLLNAVLPVSILVSGNSEFSAEISQKLGLSACISVGYYITAFAVAFAIKKALKVPSKQAGVFINTAVFANTAFIGFPLCAVLFGTEGVLYAVIYNLAYQLFLFVIGVRFFKPEEKFQLQALWKDPLTILSIFSVLLFISPIRLPVLVVGAMEQIGSLSVPLSMIIIGGMLAQSKLSVLWTSKLAFVASFLRLVAFPLGMLLVVWLAGLRGTLPITCVLLTALPAGTLNVILAQEYKSDVQLATATVVQSMVWMVIALPCILLLAKMLLEVPVV